MRSLEIILPVLLTLYLLWRPIHSLLPRLIPLLALDVMMFHLVLEGFRWQMLPLYGLTVSLAIHALTVFLTFTRRRPIFSYLLLTLLLVATALPILLPVPSIPAPSGPYRIGTRIYELTDTSRQELYSGKEEARRLQIKVWYPAEILPSDKRAPWMARADIFAPAIATYIHMPAFFLDHLALVKMPAYQDSQVAPTDGGYPVILFSHGWNGFNAQNTSQAIQLASHGYVVVGIQHPYGAVITVFNDGTVARNNPSALPSGAPDEEYEIAAQVLVDQWAGDLRDATDFLQEQNDNPASPFYEALDLTRLGAYGHSTGGGAAIQFCGTDSRCKALLGMDPFMRPVSIEVLARGVTQPAFFIFSQRWADDVESRNNELFHKFILNVPENLGVISIQGTAHYDFSDLPLLSPLAPKLGLKGPISGRRVTTIINNYLLAFFNASLKGVPTDLFEEPSQKYNEVRFWK